MKIKSANTSRWSILNKMFMDNFVSATLIELASVGAVLIDGLVVSRTLSADSMAAFGISYPFFTLTAIFFGLFATGMQTLTSHEMGSGNIKECNRIFCAALYIASIFSVIMMTCSFLCADQIAYILGGNYGSASMTEGVAEYIRGVSFGVPPIIICAVMAPAIQMDSGRKRVVISLFIYFVLDVVFDLIAAGMGAGLLGIGLATALSLCFRLVVLLFHFRKKNCLLSFVPLKTSIKEFTHLLSMGTENALRRLGNFIRPVFINKLILFYGGTMAMTAMSIRGNLCDLSGLFGEGIAGAVGLLAGVYYGERNMEAECALGKTAQCVCFTYCGIAAAILILLSRPIAIFYTGNDSPVLFMTWLSVIAVALQCPLQTLIKARTTYLQRVMRVRNMQLLIFLSTLFNPIICALILGRILGAYGVLLCYTVSDFVTLAAVWAYYAIKSKRIIPTPEDYLNFPEEFNVNPGDIISLDIRDMKDVSLTAEQIDMFCKGHKIDSSVRLRVSVCFEEAAKNTIIYGFPENRSQNAIIDFRMVISGDTLVLRIQDNCPKFDVASRIKAASGINKTGDETPGLGLKLVSGLADNVKYAYSYETNIIFLEFNINGKTGEQAA